MTPNDAPNGVPKADQFAPANGEVWVSVAVASGRLGVSERTIQRRANRGELDSRFVSDEQGKRLLIRVDLKAPNDIAADKLPTHFHAQSGVAADISARPADKLPTANDTPADTSFAQHLLEENRFLRGVIEQLQRDGAETRNALRRALELAPKQLAAPSPSGVASSVASDGSARNTPQREKNGEVGRDGPNVLGGAKTGGKRGETPVSYASIADELERMMSQ